MASISSAKAKLQDPQTKILVGLIGLILAYALATRAIDTGSLGQYGLTFLILWLSVRLIIKAARVIRYGQKR